MSMRLIDMRLRAAGFDTFTIKYDSTHAGMMDLVVSIAPQLPHEGRVHFVGHSLGGILAKHLMRQLPMDQQGRIVQLGSPNLGTEIADRVAIFEPFLGPVLEELTPHEGSDDSDLEIGAIAGNAAGEMLSQMTGVKGENDGKVSVKSAIGSAKHWIVLPVSHSTMMLKNDVIRQIIAFLRSGKFLLE